MRSSKLPPRLSNIVRRREPSARTDRFLARIDAHLRAMSDRGEQAAFLARQIESWEYRYARFVDTEGASEPGADLAEPPQAADFLLTIVGLAARRNAYVDQSRETAQMLERNNLSAALDRKPLGSAVLSLLVAADQRCPAIIGQAHLLYHSRFDAKPDATARTFAQLKRDAADLFQAIATVETAMNGTDLGTVQPGTAEEFYGRPA